MTDPTTTPMQCECPASDDELEAGTCGTPTDPEACGRPAAFVVDGIGATCPFCLPVAIEVAVDMVGSDHVAVSVVRS